MAMGKVHYPTINAKRAELGVTKQAMADRLGLSWDGLNMKLCGEREFNITELIAISDWWGVCIDELVGRTVPKCPLYRPEFGGAA